MLSSNENMYEKRLVHRLRMFWDAARGEEAIPFSDKFNSNALQDVWSSCLSFKVTIVGEKKLYLCEHVGDSLKKVLGKDLKDKYFNSVETGGIVSREFVGILDKSVDSQEFVLSQGQFVSPESKIVKYRDCVMPFKNNENKIDFLVVGISWRSF